MRNTLIGFIAGVALCAGLLADASAQTRIRGTIERVSGDTISVKSSAGHSDIHLTDKTTITFAQPIALSEIKSGDFLGVTSVMRRGSLVAYDVRRFPKPVNPGHRPFDGGKDQTMTNAAVEATVGSANGHELTLTYEGGSQKVVVSDTASVTALVPGQRSQLTAGSYVNLLAEEAGGKLTARSIEVRKDAPKLPPG